MFCQQSLLLLLWPVCKLYWERFHRTTYICMSKHQDGTCSGYCGNNIGISNYLPNLVIRFSSSGLHPALLGQEPLLRMPGVSLSGCFFIVCCLSLGCDSPYCSSLLVFPLIFILLCPHCCVLNSGHKRNGIQQLNKDTTSEIWSHFKSLQVTNICRDKVWFFL